MEHLINRLQFELNCADEESAFSFRENFSVTFQEQISNIADELCSKYVGADEWLNIDKMEIDLGEFSSGNFNSAFGEVFKSTFEKELKQKLSGISSIEKKASVQNSRSEIFKYFLLKGILPWWAIETEIDIDELINTMVTNDPEGVKQFLLGGTLNKNLWQRVVYQFDGNTKSRVFSLIDELQPVKELFEKWSQQLNLFLKRQDDSEVNITGEMINDIILRNTPEIFQNLKQENELLEIFQENMSTLFIDKKYLLNKIILENKSNFSSVNYEPNDDTINKNILGAIDSIAVKTERNDGAVMPHKFSVKHAGIILLGPFLKTFFTNLDLLNDKQWKNKDAQYKAVHLLKYLSTGTQNVSEYNVTLEKIICGLHIEEPLPRKVFLNEHEITESTSLLESVIEHWKALKKTSVYSLRKSFLKRDGLLSEKEGDWQLQVERKTLDVLIDSIPWGYSTLNFPWSEGTIFVEW